MYKELTVEFHGEQQKHIVRDNGDGSFTSFPADESNQNYQAYLAWLAEGNVPTPADQPTE
jgi:hypothetical protein